MANFELADGEVWQISSAGCECKASALQRCHHIAALSLLLHYAPRVNGAGDTHISPTAKLCRWIVPGDIFNTSLKVTPLRAMQVRGLENFGQAGKGAQKSRELMGPKGHAIAVHGSFVMRMDAPGWRLRAMNEYYKLRDARAASEARIKAHTNSKKQKTAQSR